MSIYSNLAAGSAEEGKAYVGAVLDLLGDQDPMTVLRSTVSWCRGRIEGISEERLGMPEAEAKWSIAAVLQHLADSELVWGYRLRRTLAEERPKLSGFDQDLWADRLGYAAAKPSEAMAMFSALRSANLALLEGASPADLDRVAMHQERGEESIRHMLRLYAGHDLVHRGQVERIVAAVTDSGR